MVATTAPRLRTGSDVSSDVEKDAGAPHADILAILARVESDHPDLAAATLTREVDSLLGRKPAPGPTGVSRHGAGAEAQPIT